jgi:1-pyrroline-5-carboxylate dehydrogenase
MSSAIVRVPCPDNEPVRGYAPGSPEKKALKDAIKKLSGQKIEIPLIIGGQEVKTGEDSPSA